MDSKFESQTWDITKIVLTTRLFLKSWFFFHFLNTILMSKFSLDMLIIAYGQHFETNFLGTIIFLNKLSWSKCAQNTFCYPMMHLCNSNGPCSKQVHFDRSMANPILYLHCLLPIHKFKWRGKKFKWKMKR